MPDWFSLKCYADTRNLSLSGWGYNFALRGYISDCLAISSGKKTAAQIVETQASEDLENWQHFCGRVFSPNENRLAIHDSLPSVRETSGQAPTNSTTSSLSVDLNTPDKVLAAQFAAWLAQRRTTQPQKQKTYTNADQQRWHSLRLLPLLDLMLWGELQNQPYKQHELASFIYPDEFEIDPVQKVRQTALPLAKKLTVESITLGIK